MGFCLGSSIFSGNLKKDSLAEYFLIVTQRNNLMKKIGSLLSFILLVACSSPKYTYHFDHYDYNSGKKKSQAPEQTASTDSPLHLNEETLVASASEEPVILAKETPETKSTDQVRNEFAQKYKAMSKAERKE